jgi:prepilin-type N-terminal cleavage/methylation domain-containing protein
MPISRAGSSIRKKLTASNTRQTGFTLIELAVVIFLIGLFALLTVPRLPGVGDDGMRASARGLAGTAKYLFNEAALSRREYRLLFNIDEGTYRAKRLEPDGELVDVGGPGKMKNLKGNIRFRSIQITTKGTWTSGEVTTEIHPGGWLEETVIHLDDGRGGEVTVRIMPFTGSTEVYDGFREF